jgi:general secretion pathway protein D
MRLSLFLLLMVGLQLLRTALTAEDVLKRQIEEESLRLQALGGVEDLYGVGDALVENVLPEPLPSGEISASQRSRARDQLLEEVDEKWIRPYNQETVATPSEIEEDKELRQRLEQIFLPKVEFRQLPLSQVVEALSEVSMTHSEDGTGLNMVLIDPTGQDPLVSILLRRLSLRRVLDFVVESVAYEYDLQRDAVVIRPSRGPGFGLETEFYPISRSTLIRLTGIPDTGEGVTMGDPFEETSPPEAPVAGSPGETEQALKGFLQRAGIPFEEIEGATLALADGQLIVTQTPRNHGKLRHLLRRYRKVKQVEIEARFLEVEERNLEELGIEWNLVGEGTDRVGSTPQRSLASAFSVGEEESRLVIDRAGTEFPGLSQGPPILPITVDLAEEAGPAFRYSGELVGGVDINVLVRALERQSGNDLLSAPKLTVLSGKTAQIVVAEEFRYPEMYGDTNAEVGMGDSTSGSAGVAITAGTPRSFTTRNVGVEMEVTPTVEEDNAISLRLRPMVTEFEGFVEYGGTSVAIASDTTVTVPSGFYQPVFSIRKVQTEVTIWDGATVVMGGLTREHAVRLDDRVPLLGSLPILGRLFRSTGESTQKRNLLIFVTARLVGPGGASAFQPLDAAPLSKSGDARSELP